MRLGARASGCVEAWIGTELDNDAATMLSRRDKPVGTEASRFYHFAL